MTILFRALFSALVKFQQCSQGQRTNTYGITRPLNSQSNPGKKKTGGITFTNFKLYCKAILNQKQCGTGIK